MMRQMVALNMHTIVRGYSKDNTEEGQRGLSYKDTSITGILVKKAMELEF